MFNFKSINDQLKKIFMSGLFVFKNCEGPFPSTWFLHSYIVSFYIIIHINKPYFRYREYKIILFSYSLIQQNLCTENAKTMHTNNINTELRSEFLIEKSFLLGSNQNNLQVKKEGFFFCLQINEINVKCTSRYNT